MKKEIVEQMILYFLLMIFIPACNVEYPKMVEIKITDNFKKEVDAVIEQCDGVFSTNFEISLEVESKFEEGEEKEICNVVFYCHSEKFEYIESPQLDSLCKVLANVILANIENDTIVTNIFIKMDKMKEIGILTLERSFAKVFSASELRSSLE